MELVKRDYQDGEEVYVITTLGVPPDESEAMRRAARTAKVQEYLRNHEHSQESTGKVIDTKL